MKPARFIIGALLGAFWLVPLQAQQATGTVRGRVTDAATEQALTGVVVSVGSHHALTSTDGRYVITDVPEGTDSVRARMIGYAPASAPVTIAAGETAVVDMALTQRAVELSAIVAVGYGEQRAGDITGAVANITPEQFNTGRIISPQQLIESKIAGVQVVDNNAPGGGLAVRIRGATSVNASSDPLYVIDGMPVGTGAGGGLSAGRDPLNFLNPDDIASITVLKDASAAAIYGANAANGVVIITTKKGGRHGPQIEYSVSASSSSITRVPAVLSAAQFRTAVTHDDSITVTLNRAAMLGSANTDWFNMVDRTAYGQQHDLVVSGAGESSTYRVSAGYLNEQGVIRGSGTERLSLGVNYDQHLLSDNLDVKLNARGARTYDTFQAGDVLGNAVSMAPTQPVYDPNNTTGFGTGYWDWNTTAASASNPVASLNLVTDHGTTYRSVGNLEADYHMPFLHALRANVNVGYDVTQADRQTFIPNNLAGQTRQGHGQLSLSNNSQANTVFAAYLNYAAPLGFVPGRIDVTGGYSYSQSHAEYPYLSENNLASNLLGTNGVPSCTAGGCLQNGKTVNDSKLISFFGRLNYNLLDRYLVALSVRRDGSSRFGPSNAWGVFPSVAVAWRLSQESFLRDVRQISDLKLRASYAETGNQNFADYSQYPTYTYSNPQAQYQFGGVTVSTIRPSSVDPNIKWEQTNSYDIGLDYGLFNQRISGSIDWYNKKTSDLIFPYTPAAGTNFSNRVTTNIGAMKNTGIELSLSARVLQGTGNHLSWTADFTASHNTNTLTSISAAGGATTTTDPTSGVSGGVGTYIQVLQTGQPIHAFYVCRQYFDPTTKKPVEGKYYYTTGDSTFTGTCDARGLVPDHNPAPNWIFGHTSSFTYGNFDLSFTLRAYLGNYVYNNVASSNGFYQAVSNGGSPSNMSTSVLKTGFVVPQYLSSFYIENGSFLRMDNLTLGYSFNYRGQPMRAYLTVQNVFTITGYSGVDPTAGLNGIDNNIYPRSRTVTGGLSIRL
jgi:TonB-linked SusC/RagA family outer membrane protein